MPLENYGLLKGKVIDVRIGSGPKPHFHICLLVNSVKYRVAINIMSDLPPSDLEFVIIEDFKHPILSKVQACAMGFTEIQRKPGGMALDFIRGNLFDRVKMKTLPPDIPGPDNDLNDKIQRIIQRALDAKDAVVYAIGEKWGPEEDKNDSYFGFLPGNGIHDIHMNQSNVGKFQSDDGIWQDGGLLVHFPSRKKWVGIFMKFQSQGWHTHDKTGHKLPGFEKIDAERADLRRSQVSAPEMLPNGKDPQGIIRIIGALAHGKGSPEVEYVSLLNVSSADVTIDKWKILDTKKNGQELSGLIRAGESLRIKVSQPVSLSNDGGLITLINEDGLKVDGVSYTAEQAANTGWTIVF